MYNSIVERINEMISLDKEVLISDLKRLKWDIEKAIAGLEQDKCNTSLGDFSEIYQAVGRIEARMQSIKVVSAFREREGSEN